MYAYALQIYCDFSAYTDIAIGVANLLGYEFPQNFDQPYRALTVQDFWRRWHITLSTWLRDYLYIRTLGGNRRGRVRTYANLLVTMGLGGLWHGASWNFCIWGLLHGFGLAMHKYLSETRPEALARMPRWLGWAITNLFVCLAWVLFRARDFHTALTIYAKLFGLAPEGIAWFYLPLFLLLPLVILGHALGWLAAKQARERRGWRTVVAPRFLASLYRRAGSGRPRPFALRPHPSSGLYVLLPPVGFACGLALTSWILLLILFSATNTSPFIYFQF